MKTPRILRSLLVAACLCLSLPVLAAVQLAPVVSGISSPTFVGNAGDGSNRLFIAERGGTIRVLQPGATTPTLFLDIQAKLVSGSERGLLGLAFHPLYPTDRRFFVFYTRVGDGALVISEFEVSANPNVADATETVLLVIPHPNNTNHNGGMLAFGPDGYLYIGVGDGGGGNDPPNNAQNINVLLGKILRIDVDNPNPTTGEPYSSPAGNPFVGATGRDEIFALGMRNPWRFSVDRGTGQLWVGDVGQGSREEVNSPIVNGGNYGWRVYEGTLCTGNDPALCNPANYIPPTFEYTHAGGRCSLTGGYVYRGTRATLPLGTYVYGDFCTGEILAWNGSAQTLLLDTSLNIASFGEDEQGELYVVHLGGSVSRIVATTPATTTALSSAPNPAMAGAAVTFTATVTGADPTGSVDFQDTGVSIPGCSAIALTGSGNVRTAVCSTSSLAPGVHSIVARYSGDAGNAASSSPPLSQTINAGGSPQLVNPSFETPRLGSSYRYRPSGAGVGWTFTGGSGIQANGSAWRGAAAPDGTQTAFIQNLGTIAQAITLNAGTYALTFRAARRSFSEPSGGVQPIRVTLDGVQVGGLVTPPGISFTAFSIPITITSSGAHTIQFAGTDGSGDKSTFLDMVALTPDASSILVNASFETPNQGSSYKYRPTGAGVGWTFSGTSGIQGNGSAWRAAPAPHGTQTAFIQNLGTIGQAITLNAGSYTLTFQAARRSFSEPAGSVQPIRVSIDGQQIGPLVTPSSTVFSSFSIPFSVATSGAHTIQFAGTDGSGDKSTFVDMVTISP